MDTLIGKGEKRIDAYDKVTGKGLTMATNSRTRHISKHSAALMHMQKLKN